ncbi:Co2+/Mg2+ efflux protein ApaG [Alteromonas aestuariivivens]|uniref:Protein ApaG n=1 Tax=Alteromonas aestuariivivens TaxID=1938339 RepID=A0A3D8MC57_9ALTE|nr:Co2+/Mg2+ efflux protein ApaG [Alteromonas aestuariivivens]RDV28076.1 Co2+/Mg2+ efflux protein ApaG [Alteromonas aestuariivivens]
MAEPDILIYVATRYLPEHAPEQPGKYAFAYHITIQNRSDVTVQLLNRYWLITDANGKSSEIRGAGVVGKQPIIEPGDEFQYTSGAIIDTPVGNMQGYYEMTTDNGLEFRAPIDIFTLAVPNVIN